MIAAKEGNADDVVELIKEGADIDLQDKVCLVYETSFSISYLLSHRMETLL